LSGATRADTLRIHVEPRVRRRRAGPGHRPQSLLQRLIEPEEIASRCASLAPPLASATTGAAVRVDGGYVDAILP
jgi:NAD(P)-dependent dehydrogenase (short-subunit alcohol dehydrogenase family)